MTVQRHVYLKFSEDYGSEDAITQVVERTPAMLAGVAAMRGLRIGVPSDEPSKKAWDLVLIVEFEHADDVEVYRLDPIHREYYEGFLRPRLEVIKAWNFAFDEE